MSKVNKRKHVLKEMETDDFDPPAANQQIVRIISSRGNNLHEVEPSVSASTLATNEDDPAEDVVTTFLVSMPTKFRKNMWVKRGDYVIVEPIDEGDKVKAEIVRILTPQHIKEFTKDGIWPSKFATAKADTASHRNGNNEDGTMVGSSGDSDNDDDLFQNTNRNQQQIESDSDSEANTSTDDDDDDINDDSATDEKK